jgi:tetratricopeptide (TPR) repeat protein
MTALNQFGYALLISPAWTDAQRKLRLVLSALPNDPEATTHLQQFAVLAQNSPLLLNELAWLRATSPDPGLRDGAGAVELAERARGLTKSAPDPAVLATLAAAYAEAGRFEEAIAGAEKANALARASGNGTIATLTDNLLIEFRANRAYHENSTLR